MSRTEVMRLSWTEFRTSLTSVTSPERASREVPAPLTPSRLVQTKIETKSFIIGQAIFSFILPFLGDLRFAEN